MKFMRDIVLAAVCLLMIMACNDETETLEPIDYGYAYFPLEVGRYVEYQVDSIIFDDAPGVNNVKDTVRVYVLETITEQFVNEAGDTTYRIERAQRPTDTAPWTVTDVWTAQRNSNEAIRVEENQRFVRLRFPLSEGLQWNSLKYMHPDQEVAVGTETIEMFKNWRSEVTSLHVAASVGGFAFDAVTQCIHANDENAIEIRYVHEKYARGVGLVAREMVILDSRCKRLGDLGPCQDETWLEKGEKGFILRQEIRSFN